jgi:uncharacterized DUF497 family protein
MRPVQFEWDEGNDTKSYTKHGVSREEAESVFQDRTRLDFADPLHSHAENRFMTLGRSTRPRLLMIAWTLRARWVRIISARPASRKERNVYEEKAKTRKR